MAVGGAAYLVSKAIKHSRVLAFEDLGMEAIYEFEVVDMPSRWRSIPRVPQSTRPGPPSGRHASKAASAACQSSSRPVKCGAQGQRLRSLSEFSEPATALRERP